MIERIRKKVSDSKYEYIRHAVDQSVLRHISRNEIAEAISNGEIIEEYPNDKYGPSCLIFGMTRTGRALHVQCTYPSRTKIKIITVYEPTPDEWIDFKVRRKP